MRPITRLWCGFLAALVLGPANAQAPEAPVGCVRETHGTVKVQRRGRGAWPVVTAPPSHDLHVGDHVLTCRKATAKVEIDGEPIHLDPRTELIVKRSDDRRGKGGLLSRILLAVGRVIIWVIGGGELEVDSAGVAAAARGTTFAMEVTPDGLTTLTVLEGSVDFYNDLGRVVVGAGQQSTARVGSAPTRPIVVDLSGYIEWEASVREMWIGWEVRHHPSESPDRLRTLAGQAKQDADAAPADPEAQMRAGDLLHDLGDYPAAETYYGRAAALVPDNPAPRVSLGYTLLADGRRIDAEAAFESAAALAPDSAGPLIGQAATRTTTGTEEERGAAQALLERALELEPDNALAHTAVGLLAMRRGDAAAARRAFTRATELDPNLYQALSHLAVAQLADRDLEAATESARRAVALAPASALAHESLATALFFGGQLDEARREAELALAANPNSAGAHLVLSDLYVAEGELRQGMREARISLGLDPAFAPAYQAIGMISLAQNDLANAEHAFANALELSPNFVAARTGMGVTYARQSKLAQALEMQKAAIALDSGAAATHNNLGAAYLAQGRLERAVAAFGEAIALQPDWSMPHANLAIAYLDLNRFARAVHEAELAVRLGENSARVHTTLARVYLEQNRTNKAWAALRRALELDESYALAHLQMAEVFLRLGRPRDARREQLEGIALQPSAMLETREYARTEARVEAGGIHSARLRADGRVDRGLTSYFLSAEHETGDWGRPHSDFDRTTTLGILGRQESADRTAALIVSTQDEERDRPGKAVGPRTPQDVDYRSSFDGREGQFIARLPAGGDSRATIRLGYRTSGVHDRNPDALMADPKPFPRMNVRSDGPLAEARFDTKLSHRNSLVAGVAASGEEREVSGIIGTPSPSGPPTPPTFNSFRDEDLRNAVTFYLEDQQRFGDRTRLLVGGRLAAADGAKPVLRPKASLQHDLGAGSTLVLLTRPILRDDVSELSPVDYWALRDRLTPLDFTGGGYSQTYEVQYQLTPRNGALLRVAGFHRTLTNLIVDLEDPAWAPGAQGTVLGKAWLRGAEIEWEQWLGRDVSVGAWVRYADSENEGAAGLEVPYQPRLVGQLRVDYISPTGLRANASWSHVGNRYADVANGLKLGAHDVVDTSAAYQIDLHTDVFIRIDNLLDKKATFYQGYPLRDRTVRGGVEYRF